MIFWIIAGFVGLGLYFLSQNKTEKKDRTTITRKSVIQTPDGEVHIQRTQTIDSVRTSYTKQDLSKQALKDVIPTLSHTQPQQEPNEVQEVISEPLIISNTQPHRFAPQPQQSITEFQEVKSEPLTLVPPESDTQQDLFAKKHESKGCPNCERDLLFSSFGKSGKYPDGLTKWCIECLNNHQSRLPRNKKHCPKCNKTRLKSSFYKNSKQSDGLTKWCNTCMDKSKR